MINSPQRTDSPSRTTYEFRLGCIGSYLDSQGYQTINITELQDGYLVRARRVEQRSPEILEFLHDTMEISDSPRHRVEPDGNQVIPMGYQTFLQTLGRRLDLALASSVVVTEGTNFVAVGGLRQVRGASLIIEFEAFEELLLAEEIERLVAESEIGIGEPVPARNQL